MRTPVQTKTLLLLATVVLVACPAWGDVVALKDGRRWEGTIQSESPEEVVIQTVGGPVTVPRSNVAGITRGLTRRQEYEKRKAELLGDDADGHLALARWCQEQRLLPQATYHFQLVVALSPENVEAHEALGHELYQGRWMTHGDVMKARGLVEYKGRWMEPAQAERARKEDLKRELEERWRAQLQSLARQFALRQPGAEERAEAEILAIRDPMAAPALVELLEHRHPRIRRLVLEVIAGQGFPGGDESLVKLVLTDDGPEVRRLARLALVKTGGDRALKMLLGALGSDQEEARGRAAVVLGEMGDRRTVPYLIESIKETVISGNTGAPTVGRLRARDEWILSDYDTVTAPGVAVVKPRFQRVSEAVAAASRGQLKVKTIINYEAVDALEAITGQELGPDQEAWRAWWRREGQRFLRGLSLQEEREESERPPRSSGERAQ